MNKVKWIKTSDTLPNKNGRYLVVMHFFGYAQIEVMRFATNLRKIDKYDFPTEKRPGWYELDLESGYYERSGITHWAELPDMPLQEKQE